MSNAAETRAIMKEDERGEELLGRVVLFVLAVVLLVIFLVGCTPSLTAQQRAATSPEVKPHCIRTNSLDIFTIPVIGTTTTFASDQNNRESCREGYYSYGYGSYGWSSPYGSNVLPPVDNRWNDHCSPNYFDSRLCQEQRRRRQDISP